MRNGIAAIIALVAFGASAFATIINIPDDYPTIQEGIDASSDGDTVLVQPGTYVENINFNGHDILLGSLFLTTGDTTYIEETVIDGDHIGPVITIIDIESPDIQVVGLKIQHGRTMAGVHCSNSSLSMLSCLIVDNNAGGIYCQNSSLHVTSCTIADNYSAFIGGGIKIFSSEVSMSDCNVISNSVDTHLYGDPSRGGGIYCSNSNVLLLHNDISNNIARPRPMFHYWGDGAGIYCDSSSQLTIFNNEIRNNFGGGNGVGIYCRDSEVTIENNIIAGNISEYGLEGGGIASYNCNIAVAKNTILSNSTAAFGGGIYHYGENVITINNIIRENIPDQISSQYIFVNYSNIEGGWEGEGNIDVDPLFRDPDNGDFHLMSTACGDPLDSPCIDAGDPSIDDILLNCNWGLGGLRSDMGAYGGGDSTLVGIDDYISGLPTQFALLQNYPNPFNPSTTIRYALPEQADVCIEVYNILGQKVARLFAGNQPAGHHTITWRADDFPSGVYFTRLETGKRSASIKMMVLK